MLRKNCTPKSSALWCAINLFLDQTLIKLPRRKINLNYTPNWVRKVRKLDFSILQLQMQPYLDFKPWQPFWIFFFFFFFLGVWVLGGGVLLQQSRHLDFWNPRPRISIVTKFQLSTIILKIFEISRGLGSRGPRGWGVAPTVSKPWFLKSSTSN